MSADPLSAGELRERLKGSPFVAFLDLDPVAFDAQAQTLDLRIAFRPEFQRGAEPGRWHGGLISALIDTAGDFVVIAMCRHAPPTVNFRVDYLKPAAGAFLVAKARLRRQGRTMAFVDIDVVDEADAVVALGRANYSMTGYAPSENRT
jgi:uncharacterized protein (TIGR00369 family)